MEVKSLGDEIKKFEHFCYEKNRRASFKTWVFSNKSKCNSEKMAEAGFVFTGTKHEPDSVKCFLCEKSLDCWDEDDDPWTEHLKHAPNCSFAKKQKREVELTLDEFIELRNELILSVIRKLAKKRENIVDTMFDEIIEKISILS